MKVQQCCSFAYTRQLQIAFLERGHFGRKEADLFEIKVRNRKRDYRKKGGNEKHLTVNAFILKKIVDDSVEMENDAMLCLMKLNS